MSSPTPQFAIRQRTIPLQVANRSVSPFENRPKNIEAFPRGYPSLAAFLSSDRDFSIFRSFSRLHTRVLLHKQDELVQVEEWLDELDRAESMANPYYLTTNRHAARIARNGNNIGIGSSNAATQTVGQQRQALLHDAEEKLREYNTLLASFHQHLERPEPEERQIKNVINWMDAKKPLVKAESTILSDWGDLRSPKHTSERGGLEMLLARCVTSSTWLGFIFKSQPQKTTDPQIHLIHHPRLATISRSIAASLAVFALITPIVVLYTVESMTSRLWIISGFTALFSSTLCGLTVSRNFEILSATAAYCAVMVVFVASLPGGDGFGPGSTSGGDSEVAKAGVKCLC
ncbi:hypothetical protein V8F06_006159 [Rhypophila decipiens]